MSGWSKNHTLKGSTSPYSLCMGVPPPGGSWFQLLFYFFGHIVSRKKWTRTGESWDCFEIFGLQLLEMCEIVPQCLQKWPDINDFPGLENDGDIC